MSEAITQGKVTFINHEKKYAIIEYLQQGKKKTVNGSIDEKVQRQQKTKGLVKKTHHFLVGDVVSFRLGISDRGDKMVAAGINFQYNNALDVLINKSLTDNKFIGYLKEVDGKYFVKEIESYLFFPVPFSLWQVVPTEAELNEQVTFALQNTEKKDKIVASLFNNVYIPEFNAAVKLFKSKTPIEAKIYNIKPHGIYLNIVGDKIQAKLPGNAVPGASIGGKITVIITYLTKTKIVVEKVAATENAGTTPMQIRNNMAGS